MNENELAAQLETWFNNIDRKQTNFFRNPVAKVIKSQVKNWKNWKDLPRGNPSEGLKKKIYNKRNSKSI
jgi:hypothetical protein